MIHEKHKDAGFTPLGARVLIHVEKAKEKTDGGIYIPQDTLDKESMARLEAEIIAVGEGAFLDCYIKPCAGDKVSISKYAGLVYKGGDKDDYRIVRDDEIVAVHSVFDPQEELEKERSNG